METKVFSIRTILSVTTGLLLTRSKVKGDNGISDIYELLGHMTDDSPFTHQLSRFSEECKPWLLKWMPELEVFATTEAMGLFNNYPKNDQGIDAWIERIRADDDRIKFEYNLPKVPKGEHVSRDPVDELCGMVGSDKVIVVKL